MLENNYLKVIVVLLIFITVIPVGIYSQEIDDLQITEEEIISSTARGRVLEIISETEEEILADNYSFRRMIQIINVKITSGKYKDEIIEVQNIIDDRVAYSIVIHKGDRIMVYLQEDQEGNILSAYADEIIRDTYLLYLLILFIIALSVVGGLKGIKAIIALGLTAVVIIKLFFPLIIMGNDPIFVSVLLCIGIIIISLFIIGGINKKSISAIIGTSGGVMLAGILALAFGSMARLTGLGNQEAQMLNFISQEVSFNFQGLLFAGIIIGALGAVMDVGMSVASAMNEIKETSPQIKTKHLIKAGINVGRDIMGTMSNTLILAYMGGTIHLIILFMFYEIPIVEIINQDVIASEIVRALAGSIGLVFAVPFTAVVAGMIYKKPKNTVDKKQESGGVSTDPDYKF
jgi:uncharacterized membrane protein